MSLKIRRGTNDERLTITPAEGELIYTTDTKILYVGDGTTVGGNVVTSSGGGSGYDGSRGDTGYTGSKGLQGDPGSAATIAVGSVTAGAPGTNPIITNSGSTGAATFNFTIPTGFTGSAGTGGGGAGNAATITVGTVTAGAPGTNPIITNSGTSSDATFNFTIPTGYTGSKGTDGTNGTNGTFSGTLDSNLNTSTYNITNGYNLTINGNDGSITTPSIKSIDSLAFNNHAQFTGPSVDVSVNMFTFYTSTTNFNTFWTSFYSTNNTVSSPSVNFARNRGSLSLILPLQLDDEIGVLGFGTRDTSAYGFALGAKIVAKVDGTVSNGILPTRVVISTIDSTGAYTDSIKINSSQITMNVPPVVPVYANNTARDAGIPTPVKGMIAVVGSNFYGYNGTIWVQLNN